MTPQEKNCSIFNYLLPETLLVSDMCIQVTSINMDLVVRIVILLDEGMEKFLNFTCTRAYVHTSDVTVDWTRCHW